LALIKIIGGNYAVINDNGEQVAIFRREGQAKSSNTQLLFDEKPKRKRRTKAEMEAARDKNNAS